MRSLPTISLALWLALSPPAWAESVRILVQSSPLAGSQYYAVGEFWGELRVGDLLELLEDRYNHQSTVVTSQLPVAAWHAYLNEPTLADAILDRLVHNAYTLNLTGESMRKRPTPLTNPTVGQ